MKNREDALVEIEKRCYDNRVEIAVNTFKRAPTRPIDSYAYPAIFMYEGDDELVQASQRDALGYPAKRLLEVTLEIITDETTDIKAKYRKVRNAVLSNPVVAPTATIKEIRTEGPVGFGLPDVLGMRLVLALSYIDDGQ